MYIHEDAMRVAKWGNSLAIRLPRQLVEALALKEGDEVEIAGKPGPVPALEVSKDTRREAAIARIKAASWPLPPGFKFDRNELYDNARRGFKPDDDAD
jgi:antitoxin MazE